MGLDRRRLAYYVPVDEFVATGMSLVEHAQRKMLYHELSPIYELAIARDTIREVQFLKGIIPHGSGIIVDLGCGVGRHVGALSQVGYDGIGVDLSEEAVRRASSMWPKCRFVIQDFRDVRLTDWADAAVCMWSTFNYLSTEADIERFKHSMVALLRPGGKMVIDMPNPTALKRGPYVRRSENASYSVEVTIEKRVIGGIAEALYQYRISDKSDGSEYLATDQELNRMYSLEEVESLLGAHFAVTAVYGDYDKGARYDAGCSARMITELQRR